MTMTPVGTTAQWIAAARALETESADPLFSDPFARELAGDAGFSLMTTMRQLLGATDFNVPDPYLSIRTRYLDDELMSVTRERHLDQVVMLAAGMDTRAFRLDWPPGVVLFELDRDDVFDAKEPTLQRQGATAKCHRRIVRTDLAGEWVGPLLAAGFDRARPAAFLVEGLLMYLEPAAVQRLVGAVSMLAADGSWIGLDVVNTEMLESPFTAAYMKKLTELGCGWRFATSDPERFFARFGWTGRLIAPGDPEAHYDRWPFPPLPRALPGIPRSFLLSATKGAPVVEQQPAPVSAQSAEHYTWGQQCDGWHLVKRERLSVIQERMPPGATEVRHYHTKAMQFFYVLSGALEIEVEGVTHVLEATHGMQVTAGAVHQVVNPGPAAAEFLVVSQPSTAGDREPAPAG